MSEPRAEKKLPDVLAEFNIEKGPRPILLPIRIQKRDYPFLLDTGASISVFDTSLRKLLGQPLHEREIDTLGGPMKAQLFDPPEAFLGELDLRKGGPVTCWDLDGFRRATGRDIRGVLGMGFLDNYVVRIDFDSGKVQFRRWDGLSHPEWGSAIHLYQRVGHEPNDRAYAKATLPRVGDIRFAVDSGSFSSACLVREVFDASTDQIAASEGLAETLVGIRHYRMGRVTNLALGEFEHRGLLVEEGGRDLIGLRLLSRYTVTFDFVGMKMYLRKGQTIDKQDEADMSGLHLRYINERITVHSVDPDSPTEAAGIKAEDVILKVGVRNALQMDIWDLRDLLKSGDGEEIRLTLKRGKEEKVASFKLKKRI